MKPTLNEKFLAYLALFSGLFLSLVAEYYSILGLASIFSAAVIPVVIMGIALGLAKVTATLWLKQNWSISPWTMRLYLFAAIVVLMLVTSMGIFGFLSKAHSDQSLVSGDVAAKIAVYDEKIKTSKENIDANRKALKQMDEAVDQVMGRSSDEKGADKAVAIRKAQQKERSRLLSEITTEQTTVSKLNEERAPIAAEVRKVEAEVGPIKYIAQFVYGEANEGLLEKAVTWVIIILIVVFDPMAVILLLSSQISFQDFRKREQEDKFGEWTEDDFDQIAEENLARYNFEESTEGDSPEKESDVVSTATVTEYIHCHKCDTELINAPGIGLFCPNKKCDVLDGPFDNDEPTPHRPDTHPYLRQGFKYPEGWEHSKPIVHIAEGDSPARDGDDVVAPQPTVTEYSDLERPGDYLTNNDTLFVQNEEQKESDLWTKTIGSTITQDEYFKTAQQRLQEKK